MNNAVNTVFGLTISFTAPGLMGIGAAALHVPAVRSWLAGATTGAPTPGETAVLLLAATATGVFLSGLRYVTLEPLLRRGIDTAHDGAARGDLGTEVAYQNIRAQFYDFYLFYANTLEGLLILSAAAVPLATTQPAHTTATCAAFAALAGLILYLSARDAFRRYQKRRRDLLGTPAGERPAPTKETA